jgi:hypothetical protein
MPSNLHAFFFLFLAVVVIPAAYLGICFHIAETRRQPALYVAYFMLFGILGGASLCMAWAAFYGNHPIGAAPFLIVVLYAPFALLLAALLFRLTKIRNRLDNIMMAVSAVCGAMLLCVFFVVPRLSR